MSKNIIVRTAQSWSQKNSRRAPIIALILSVLAVVCAAFYVTGHAQPSTQQSSVAAARNAALIAATNDVLRETSEIRQLAILGPVQSSAQSRAEIERMIVKNLEAETTPAQVHATEVTLKTLGLVPQDFDFRSLMIRLLREQVAGYYDPKMRQFHLADWIDVDGQRPIMAHELTHALQDQHFNLRRFEHWPKGDADAELAAHALIEGDAMFTMLLYVNRSPLRQLALIKSMTAAGQTTVELDHAPSALRETLLFPYRERLSWTTSLYRQALDKNPPPDPRAGWNAISQAFTVLPQSTEQVLHPEKYFVHEPPVKLMVPDIAASLGASWRRIDSDVNGEWGLYLILDQFLKSPADSRRAAAGWGGDRYAVYEDPRGEVVYVSLSAWDTERDAREFFDAYVKRTQLRYSDAASEASSTTDTQRFQVAGRRSLIEIRGVRVLIAEGLPSGPAEPSLLKTLGMN